MSDEPRKKASEFSGVFGREETFAEAFPQIEALSVRVRYTGDVPSWKSEDVFSRVGEHIDCVNELCYSGGFSIGSVLRDMVATRDTHRDGVAVCRGNEASPKGRRIYRRCANGFHYSVSLTYRA